MKTRKTYGINGLLEWHGLVESHGVKMKVDFTNGSATAYGVAPATFTTTDALTQYILENSEQFKKGKIQLLRSYVIEADANAKAEEKPKAEEKAEEKLVEVKVNCVEDAKEYLITNFGIASNKLRSRAQVENSAKQNGVKFIWED